MPNVNVKLDLVVRIHGGSVLRGIAVDEKGGKPESHITIATTAPLIGWPFALFQQLITGSPLSVPSVGTSPTKEECATALSTRLTALNAALSASSTQMVGGQTHYWTGTRWVFGPSPLAYQYGYLILQTGLGGAAPYEQLLTTGQGTTTNLMLDFVVVMSPG